MAQISAVRAEIQKTKYPLSGWVWNPDAPFSFYMNDQARMKQHQGQFMKLAATRIPFDLPLPEDSKYPGSYNFQAPSLSIIN